MIYDRIENLSLYEKALPQLAKVKEIMKDLEVGRYEMNGEDYFVVSSYEPKPFSGTYEFHEKYIDVQMLISGKEKIKCVPLKNLTVTQAYDESKDVGFGSADDGGEILLNEGAFAVFFPDDGHAPGIKVQEGLVKKIVLKIKL